MSQHLDQISLAGKLYAASGQPLNKVVFKRALAKVAEIEISDRAVDLVFAIFDKDRNGVLDYSEFATALRPRASLETTTLKM